MKLNKISNISFYLFHCKSFLTITLRFFDFINFDVRYKEIFITDLEYKRRLEIQERITRKSGAKLFINRQISLRN
jgi:hypothetical protein